MEKLSKLRNEIDLIDREIIHLLWKRFSIVWEVWRHKSKINIPALQKDRWNTVLESMVLEGEKISIPPGTVKNIWNEIHAASLDIENKILKNITQ